MFSQRTRQRYPLTLPPGELVRFTCGQLFDLHQGEHLGNATLPLSTAAHPISVSRLLSANGYFTGNIGKHHVGPMDVYAFDFMRTIDTGYDVLQVGRNITAMKKYMLQFFDALSELSEGTPFFLYMAFIDTHRGCNDERGPFCNRWGNGSEAMGSIPDWTPVTYDADTLSLPFWVPDTAEARSDYAQYLEAYSRLDQGVGLFLEVLKDKGHLDDTLIVFASDNGEPFPSAKTNLYEQGQIEPFLVSIPEFWQSSFEGEGPLFSDFAVSTTDVLPTVLEWTGVAYPKYALNGAEVVLTGQSLLSIVQQRVTANSRATNIFGSHIFHEATMYYPMRSARNAQFRLIRNLNWRAPFHIAGDLYHSPTWQTVLDDADHGQPTEWFKNLSAYYFRDEWELFDVVNDPTQTQNLAQNAKYSDVFDALSKNLSEWMLLTNDPWANCNANYACS